MRAERLLNCIQSGRIPHAILIAGPAGSGRAELEAGQIAEMGAKGRQAMQDRFDQAAPEIVGSLALEVAARYGGAGRE